ncbi:actin depolymerizing protein [Dacryopinax primogenitus]|uniref:Actin depolymerizing protein n=1 Tax=Dacryopinax primogenitus (strain DJM 731) TaxID=1858805 RepID=M5G0X6_DACPD|nr:actin depolymerizing protein [Dacryopinax primogenitus]EJU02394.1 actin depolymerizing protein [Dacryopinax primogenitus]
MADVSDSAIAEAYADVRDDKSETNWMLVAYEGDKGDKLVLGASGNGGLKELAEAFDDGQAQFAYCRVNYSNDPHSTREKFVFVTWIGPGTRVMRKAKVSVHAGDVKQVLRQYSIEVAARERGDLEEGPIVVRLRKAGGASYDGV